MNRRINKLQNERKSSTAVIQPRKMPQIPSSVIPVIMPLPYGPSFGSHYAFRYDRGVGKVWETPEEETYIVNMTSDHKRKFEEKWNKGNPITEKKFYDMTRRDFFNNNQGKQLRRYEFDMDGREAAYNCKDFCISFKEVLITENMKYKVFQETDDFKCPELTEQSYFFQYLFEQSGMRVIKLQGLESEQFRKIYEYEKLNNYLFRRSKFLLNQLKLSTEVVVLTSKERRKINKKLEYFTTLRIFGESYEKRHQDMLKIIQKEIIHEKKKLKYFHDKRVNIAKLQNFSFLC